MLTGNNLGDDGEEQESDSDEVCISGDGEDDGNDGHMVLTGRG